MRIYVIKKGYEDKYYKNNKWFYGEQNAELLNFFEAETILKKYNFNYDVIYDNNKFKIIV